MARYKGIPFFEMHCSHILLYNITSRYTRKSLLSVAVEPTNEKANWFALVEEEEEEEEAREIALMDPHIKRGARAWHEHLFRLPHKK